MIGRRSLLLGILSAAAAPAIVRASSLMPVVPRRVGLMSGEIGIIDAGFRFVSSPMLAGGGWWRIERNGDAAFNAITIDPMSVYKDAPASLRQPAITIIEPDLSRELRQALASIRRHA